MNDIMASVFPGVPVLDDLELLRLGLINRQSIDLPAEAATVVDAEGVPVAGIDAGGRIDWLECRSSRPFEGLHLRDTDVTPPVAVVNDRAGLAAVPEGTRTIVLLASTDGEDSDRDIALARYAVTRTTRMGATLRIAPLGARAQRWREKRDQIRTALGGDDVADLTAYPGGGDESTHDSGLGGSGGLVVLLSGLSGSGKSTIARALRNRLVENGERPVSLLDGDLIRRHLSAGLTFSVPDRETNVRRIGWVAAEIARHGGLAIASPIAPFESTRREVGQMVRARGGRFVLVHVATPLEECERRDRKGLYAAARRGEIPDFTGISSPYEEPISPSLKLDTTGREVDPLVDEIVRTISISATAQTTEQTEGLP